MSLTDYIGAGIGGFTVGLLGGLCGAGSRMKEFDEIAQAVLSDEELEKIDYFNDHNVGLRKVEKWFNRLGPVAEGTILASLYYVPSWNQVAVGSCVAVPACFFGTQCGQAARSLYRSRHNTDYAVAKDIISSSDAALKYMTPKERVIIDNSLKELEESVVAGNTDIFGLQPYRSFLGVLKGKRHALYGPFIHWGKSRLCDVVERGLVRKQCIDFFSSESDTNGYVNLRNKNGVFWVFSREGNLLHSFRMQYSHLQSVKMDGSDHFVFEGSSPVVHPDKQEPWNDDCKSIVKHIFSENDTSFILLMPPVNSFDFDIVEAAQNVYLEGITRFAESDRNNNSDFRDRG